MESYGVIESFTDLEDAFHFMDHKILEYLANGWEVRDGCGIERTGVRWRVGLVFVKEKDGSVVPN